MWICNIVVIKISIMCYWMNIQVIISFYNFYKWIFTFLQNIFKRFRKTDRLFWQLNVRRTLVARKQHNFSGFSGVFWFDHGKWCSDPLLAWVHVVRPWGCCRPAASIGSIGALRPRTISTALLIKWFLIISRLVPLCSIDGLHNSFARSLRKSRRWSGVLVLGLLCLYII